MKATMKRMTALALSLMILFSVLPAGAAPWDPWGFLPFFSPWFDPVSGAELEEAKTTATSDDGTLIMYVGEQANWNGTLDDKNPNSDPSVATAEKTGNNLLLIKALQKDGFTTLRFTGTAFCTVRVIKPSVELTRSEITVEPGSEYYLRAKTNCRDQDGDGELTWSSSDPSAVSVDGNGKLTIAPLPDSQESATAKITCKMKYTTHAPDGTRTKEYTSAECTVTVKRLLRSIVLDASNLEMYTDDDPVTVNITGCSPAYFYTDETIAKMDVYSSKPSVLGVTANGKELTLTPEGKGTAKVVVSYKNENGTPVEAYVIVKVLDEGLEVSPANMELPAGSSAAVVAEVHPERKAGTVTVISSDPSVATAEWNAGDTQAVVRGLKPGTAELTFTMGSLKRTATVTVTDPVGKDADLYTVSFVDYDGKVLCAKETVLSTAAEPNFVTVPDVNTPRDGYTFDHFERDEAPGVAYYAGTDLEVTGNMTLRAVYVPGTCTVTYANTAQSAGYGVPLPDSENVPYGETATKPTYGIGSDGKPIEKEVPEDGESRYYRFIGWKTEDGTEYTFTDPVMSSITLYPVWEKVQCVITVRTFKGAYPSHDEGVFTVDKGKENFTVNNLKMFKESDGDFYTYTYTNANGVGKVVYFQFWQYGSERITSGSYHFDKVLDDATFTAVYEPGNPRSVGGTAVNDSTNSYYHSTNVYVPVNWKRTDNGAVVLDDMIMTNVYPQYGLKTSNVFGMVYEYHTSRDQFPEQDAWDQLKQFNAFGREYNATKVETAKYGLVNLSDMVGTEITGTDGKNYIVTGIDQSRVEAVWLCTCDGHTFNGYCLGGTWNAIGQVTLFVEEKLKAAPKIKVNYFLLPEAETDAERDAYRNGVVTEEQKNRARLQDITSTEIPYDEVLTYRDYVDNMNGIWPAVSHDWIQGKEGELTTENGEYVLNLYYADIFYRVKVFYHYVNKPEDAGNTNAPLVPASDLGKSAVNPWTNNDHHYYYNDKFEKQTPAIANYSADRLSVSGKFIDRDIEEHVYYEPLVTIYYKALVGGQVTTVEEKVRRFTGEAAGSTAVADTANHYVVKGWYADKNCSTQLLDAKEQTSKKFVPERPAGGWVDGTTYWAKFIKEIVITSADGTWPYDGSFHTNPVYTVTYGGEPVTDVSADGKTFTLPTGDTVTIIPDADAGVTRTGDSGKDNNTFTYTVTNKYDSYSVSTVTGDLSVTPAVLLISSANREWTYDGKAGTNPVYSVTLNGTAITDRKAETTVKLPSGDTLTISDPASATHVSDTAGKTGNNTFTYALDKNADQYTVQTDYGDLTVNPAPLTVITDSDQKVYDGTPLTADGRVEGFMDGDTYAFGATGSQTDLGSSTNTYTLSYTGSTQSGDYRIVKEDLGTLTVIPAAMSIQSPNGEWTYDGDPHQTDTMTVTYGGKPVTVTRGGNGSFTGTLPTGDVLTVTPDKAATVVHVDDTAGKTGNNTFTWSVATAGGADRTDFYKKTTSVDYGDLTVNPAPLTVITDSDQKVYDGTPLTADGRVEGFMDGDTYTFGTTGSQTETGESKNPYDLVFDGTADPDDYYIAKEDIGTLTVVPEKIVIKSPDGEWTYDGDPHQTDTMTVTYGGKPVTVTRGGDGSFTGTLPTGDTITVTPTKDATVTHVSDTAGKTENNTFTWTVTAPDGSDKTGGYKEFTTAEYGDLTVRPAPLTVVTDSDVKGYDGTPLTADGTVEGFMEGETYTFRTTGSQTVPGESDNLYDLIFDGTADPDDYYLAGEDIGTLTVVPKEIVIKSPDGEWTYDGDPHQTDTLTVTYGDDEIPMTRHDDGSFTGTLPTGDKITVTPTEDATVTHVGETKGKGDNTFTWTVENPDNYPDVTAVYGDLTVRPAPLVIVTDSAEKVYDGEPLTAGGTVAGFADGDTYTFTVTGSQTETGSSENGYTLAFDGTADPDDYYIADEQIGILKVTPEHKVTVHYWEEEIGGNPIHPDAVAVYDEGDEFHIPSPVIPGYTVDIRIVEGTVGTGDLVYDVIYTPVEHTLTVNYVDEDGNPVHDPHTETHPTGEHYEVGSPVIDGYTTVTTVVEGEMPGHDTVITVIYFKPSTDLVTINDYDTPLSIGGLNVNAGDCYE